jgi:uncharacterized protein
MRLVNEFVVSAPPDVVWEHLLDMERVASCVPGARIEEIVPPDTYKGKIRLKIGPMTVEYRGEATLVEVHPDAREATIRMKAREARGQGSALATVRNRLEEVPEGTRVVAETDLEITGPQAQFGKGVLEDVGSRVLDEFTARLERQIAASTGAVPVDGGTEANGSEPEPSPASDDALDLNRLVGASLRSRPGLLAGAGAFVALVVLAVVRQTRRTRRTRRTRSPDRR